MWVAYFQANEEMRHTIATSRFKLACWQALEDFIDRMTLPQAVLWWAWVEETNDRPGIPDVCSDNPDVPSTGETK